MEEDIEDGEVEEAENEDPESAVVAEGAEVASDSRTAGEMNGDKDDNDAEVKSVAEPKETEETKDSKESKVEKKPMEAKEVKDAVDPKEPQGVKKSSFKWEKKEIVDGDKGDKGALEPEEKKKPLSKWSKSGDQEPDPKKQKVGKEAGKGDAQSNPPQKKKPSKWALPDDEEEEDQDAGRKDHKAGSDGAAGAPSKPKKSRWAEDSDEEDSKEQQSKAVKPAATKEKELLSKAAGASDAMSALDLLEDKLKQAREGGGEQEEADGGDKDVEMIDEQPASGEKTTENTEAAKTEKKEPAPEPSGPQLIKCREVDKAYQKLNKIDEGTYGVVFRAKCRKTERIVALKQVKLERARDGFPLTALRELTVLLALTHPNIVDVFEIVVSPKKQVFMAMEYMEHDFRALMETMKSPFRTGQVKCLMKQLLAGVEFMHRHWVIHRDLKTSNLLMDNRGHLKICDFGLARLYRDPSVPMTPEVVTLWYRAPELLYGTKKYTISIDMWSVGCIFAELLLKEPILKSTNEEQQRAKIAELIGPPSEDNWSGFKELPGSRSVKYKNKPGILRERLPKVSYTGQASLSELGYNLLSGMLNYDPVKRTSAAEALKHPYFPESPLPVAVEDMPTWPSTHEAPKGAKKRARSPTAAEAFLDDERRYG